MLSNQTPSRIPLAFATGGTKNTIPVASQIGITPGAASLTDGFPPATFVPLAAGGLRPAGADFNGVFNMITAIQKWQSAGGLFTHDAAFSDSVGGYPKGCILVKADLSGIWFNNTDGNTTNPDAGGAGWGDLGNILNGRPGHTYTANDWTYLDKSKGLILQWGEVVGTTAMVPYDRNLIFPIPYVITAFCVIGMVKNPTSEAGYSARTTNIGANGAWISNSNGSLAAADAIFWVSIGI